MSELRECPFCGGQAEYHATSEGSGYSRGYVRCVKFCCEQGIIQDVTDAIEDWNNRVNDKELQFTRKFIHEHGLEFTLASKLKGARL